VFCAKSFPPLMVPALREDEVKVESMLLTFTWPASK
jgi:hypothetical protein